MLLPSTYCRLNGPSQQVSSQVTFFYTELYIIQIVSKQLFNANSKLMINNAKGIKFCCKAALNSVK